MVIDLDHIDLDCLHRRIRVMPIVYCPLERAEYP
jgi:hypothetical protein